MHQRPFTHIIVGILVGQIDGLARRQDAVVETQLPINGNTEFITAPFRPTLKIGDKLPQLTQWLFSAWPKIESQVNMGQPANIYLYKRNNHLICSTSRLTNLPSCQFPINQSAVPVGYRLTNLPSCWLGPLDRANHHPQLKSETPKDYISKYTKLREHHLANQSFYLGQ